MRLSHIWLLNLFLLAVAFFLLRWPIWNMVASINFVVWIMWGTYLWWRGNLKWPLSVPIRSIGIFVTTASGLVLLIEQAPSALWLFALGHTWLWSLEPLGDRFRP